jgi:transposase
VVCSERRQRALARDRATRGAGRGRGQSRGSGKRGQVAALEIEQLKYQIAKLRHEQYGQSSERSAVLEQLELKLSELEEDASEAEAAAQLAAERARIAVAGFERAPAGASAVAGASAT